MKKYLEPELEMICFNPADVLCDGISLTGNNDGNAEGTIPDNWDYGD